MFRRPSLRRSFSASGRFASFIRLLRDIGWQASRKTRAMCRPTKRYFRPVLQELEARQLLATLTWTGDGADDLFSNADNWTVTSGTSATGVPTTGDDAIINSDPDSDKVQVNASVTVNSISTLDGIGEPFEIIGGTLTLTSA